MTSDPYVEFERLYVQRVAPRVRQLLSHSDLNEGICNTLGAATNHFHSGVLLLLGDLLHDDLALAAALAEISWTALIVVDDAVDGQEIRRGRQAVWAARGSSYAIHSAWNASLQIARTIRAFESTGALRDGTQEVYLSCLQRVLAGQALRNGLRLDDSVARFRRVMLTIASHLGGMVRTFVVSPEPRFVPAMLRALRTLSYAASLKNDLEDVFPPASSYSPGGIDLQGGQITYVWRAFYHRMSSEQQRLFDQIVSRHHASSDEVRSASGQILGSDEVRRALSAELAAVVQKSEHELDRALQFASTTSRRSSAAELLRDWIRSHAYLGNSRIGIRFLDATCRRTPQATQPIGEWFG